MSQFSSKSDVFSMSNEYNKMGSQVKKGSNSQSKQTPCVPRNTRSQNGNVDQKLLTPKGFETELSRRLKEALDLFTPEAIEEVIDYLNPPTYFKRLEYLNDVAVDILIKHTDEFKTENAVRGLLLLALCYIPFVAITADIMIRRFEQTREQKAMIRCFDQISEVLLNDDKSIKASVDCLGQMASSSSYKFKELITRGLKTMTGGGVHSGYWSDRRSKKFNHIADFRIWLLSELVLAHCGGMQETKNFSTLRGSQWFLTNAESTIINPMDVSRLTWAVIGGDNHQGIDENEYLLAMVKLVLDWAANQPIPPESYVQNLTRYFISPTLAQKAIQFAKATKEMLLNLCDTDKRFTNISGQFFKYLCENLITSNALVETTQILGEFLMALQLCFIEKKCWTPRRNDIENSLLHCTISQLFNISSRSKTNEIKDMWKATTSLINCFDKEDVSLQSSLQANIEQCVIASNNEDIIAIIPISILEDLTRKNTTDHQALLLRYFQTCGNRLFAAHFYTHNNEIDDVLKNCKIFLNRNFSDLGLIFRAGSDLCDLSSADKIYAYLAPFESIIRGIISRFNEEKKYDRRIAFQAVVTAIYGALRLLAEAKTYAMVFEREKFWHVVTDVFLNRVVISTGLSPLIGQDFLHQLELTKAVESFEETLYREDTMSSPSVKLYLSVMVVLGESINSNTMTHLLKRYPNDEYRAISESLEICINVLTAGHGRKFFTKYITAYVKASLENVIGFLNKNQFILPRSLALLPDALKVSGAEGEIMDNKRKIEDRIINVLTTFQLKNITKLELDLLYRSPSIIDSFNHVARKWDVDSSELLVLLNLFCIDQMKIDRLCFQSYPVVIEIFLIVFLSITQNLREGFASKLLDEFVSMEQENDALGGVLTFLEQRGLLMHAPDLRKRYCKIDSNIMLSRLIGNNEDFSTELNFDEEVLLALKTFSRGSVMFSLRFDDHDPKVMATDVAGKTKMALEKLRDLVCNNDAYIDDFKVSLPGFIAELQNRHRSKISLELEQIVHYFTATATKSVIVDLNRKVGEFVLNETLTNLNAAFNLMRYRDVLVPFKTSLIDLQLVPDLVRIQLEDSVALNSLMQNFRVSDAPSLLNEVQESIARLSHSALIFVGKLTNADLLLHFLRKYGGSLELGALDRAQERARFNAHASGVLMNLLVLQTLLDPFYNHKLQTLDEIREHLEIHLVFSADGRDCISIAQLVSVSENWAEVEIYFRDSGKAQEGIEDIRRSIVLYQETGQFISSLSAHPGGAALSFTYKLRGRGGASIDLTPDLLQEHVQWAVLGGDISELIEFVRTFSEAQRAHAIRLLLEEEGHPDHQVAFRSDPVPLAETCRLCDVSNALQDLSEQIIQWRYEVSQSCADNPRLLLLNRRSRVQLMLALRDQCPSYKDILPYMIQCFPALLFQRSPIQNALHSALKEAKESSLFCKEGQDLQNAGTLVALVISHLKRIPSCSHEVSMDFDGEIYIASRLDLQNSNAIDIYRHHLSDVLRQNFVPSQPRMTVWCDRSTTESAIKDILLVASIPGLCRVVHFVRVDRLILRIQEVLLRGIEETKLRTPLLLIFGDRDGVDSFSQFQPESVSDIPNNLGSYLWASKAVSDNSACRNAEVYVIVGKGGMGKSRWIKSNIRDLEAFSLTFTVHEGFSVASLIKRYREAENQMLAKNKSGVIALQFIVLEFANMGTFSIFLHYLLALGLLVDEEGGTCRAILPGSQLILYIELPEVHSKLASDEKLGAFSCWPPTDDTKWNPKEHPYLIELPVLAVAVPHNHYVSIREQDQYKIGEQGRLVAHYLSLAKNSGDEFGKSKLPTAGDIALLCEIDRCPSILEDELFVKYRVSISKRVRSCTILLLYERCLYLQKIQSHVADPKLEQDSLKTRMAVKGSFKKVLKLFICESVDIARDSKTLAETSVFTIRPDVSIRSGIVGEFEVLVTTQDNPEESNYKKLLGYFMEAKQLVVSDGVIPSELRANIAGAFGLEDTSCLLSTIRDCGHLLTPESLVRLLHMHGRRNLGSSIIYEGETGVGKSQNLKLYSLLINANTSLFTNLKLHLVAVIHAIGEELLRDIDEIMEDCDNVATRALTRISITCNLEEILNTVMIWVRCDAQLRLNLLGSAVCAYFNKLFDSYPLNREGCQLNSKAAYEILTKVGERSKSSTVDRAYKIAESAEKSNFLMERPQNTMRDERDVLLFDPLTTPFIESELPPMFAHEADLRDFLHQLVSAPPVKLYHRLLADDGLTPLKWRNFLATIIAASIRIHKLSASAIVCVFVDELNTAGCPGMVNEAFIMNSLDGEALPSNILFVGAVNPFRDSSAPSGIMDFTKSNIGQHEEDENSDYLTGSPYIVRQLSSSMESIKVWYPNLDDKAEESFVEEYFDLHFRVPKPFDMNDSVWQIEIQEFSMMAQHMIIKAQQLVRGYNVPRVFMSIRNLIRCTQLLTWLLTFSVPTERGVDGIAFNHQNIFLPGVDKGNDSLLVKEGGFDHKTEESRNLKKRMRSALIMSITVTYVFQLPSYGHVIAGKAKEDLRFLFIKDIVSAWDTGDNSVLSWGGWGTRECFDQKKVEEWKIVIAASLTHLFSCANIPQGLAHTIALKENLYCVVLCAINKWPLLITGPPGCGKTLSFILACDTLRGRCPNHSVAFQSIVQVKKITYQCSIQSTGPEIAAVFNDAHLKQEFFEAQQPGRNLCLVGLDEAGLSPENRQALKSTHDFLDMRIIGTVMMSNTTLDAAKTSRTVQLLQTQANMEDLWELAWGIIAAEDALSVSEVIGGTWKAQVRGICEAFQSLGEIILVDNWFHSRDFIFLCRMLRLMAQSTGLTLFDAPMLLTSLRRHFQALDPSLFPAVASHFLNKCHLMAPTDDLLDSRVVSSLRASLKDKLIEGADPTTAHCRYTLVVDPTDCEAAVDLLFALKLLDQGNTKVVTLSDFPEDASPTMTTAALAQVKMCIEEGKTLLLINSAILQSALYDVINRHYAVSVSESGERMEFASIPLGSFSSLVQVHKEFHLIVHIPSSQLAKTPLPFLNRLEKYTLSVRDVLTQRITEISINPPLSLRSIQKPSQRKRLFHELQRGVEDFVDFAGGTPSFYGMSATETVPSLILRALEDCCDNGSSDFKPRPSALSGILLLGNTRNCQEEDTVSKHFVTDATLIETDSDNLSPQKREEESISIDYSDRVNVSRHQAFDAMNDPASTRLRNLIRALNFQVMETARVESVFRLRGRLPAVYMREYLEIQEHLSVVSLIHRFLNSSPRENKISGLMTEKLVIYTRTDGFLLRLVTDNAFASKLFGSSSQDGVGLATASATAIPDDNSEYQTITVHTADTAPYNSSKPTICIIPLAIFTNSVECARAISNCMAPDGGRRVIIVVADMKQIAASQVTFARRVIDKEMARCISYQNEQTMEEISFQPLPIVFVLLHISADQLQLRPCYQTISLNGWSAIYVDAFSDGLIIDDGSDSEIDIYSTGGYQNDRIRDRYSPKWMRVAFFLDRTPSLLDVRMEFRHLAVNALTHAIQACSFQQHQRQDRRSKISDRQMLIDMGIDVSMEAYGEGNKDWVVNMIRSHPYIIETLTDSFAILWGRLLESTVQDNCDRISRGITSKGLVSSVRASHKWLLSDFLLTIIKNDLAAHWGLEALGKLPPIDSLSSKDLMDINNDSAKGKNQIQPGKVLIESGSVVDVQDVDLIAITVHILRAVVTLRSNDCKQLHLICSSTRVDCNNSRLALTPLYHSLMRILEEIIPQSRLKANKSRTRNSVGTQINHEVTILRRMIEENKSYCEIASAMLIIENQIVSWKAWSRDFISVTLGYGKIGHSEIEIELLSSFASTLPEILLPIRCADSNHREGDICQWLLLKEDLRNYLYKISHVLITTRSILNIDDLREILRRSLQQEIAIEDRQIYRLLIRQCVQRLWELVLILLDSTGNLSLERDQVENSKGLWIKCIRDLIGMKEINVEILLNEKSEGLLSKGDSRKLFVMTILFKIVGITGLDMSFLNKLLVGTIIKSVSLEIFYPVQITLTLLAYTATILKEKIDKKHNMNNADLCNGYSSNKLSFELGRVLAHVTNECLYWIFNMFDTSVDNPGFIILIVGLIGNKKKISEQLHLNDMENTTVESLSSLLMSLSLSAKCDMIHHLMLMDGRFGGHNTCSVLNDLLDTNLLQNERCYIPNIVAAGLAEYTIYNVFEKKVVSPDDKCIAFDKGTEGSINGHSIIFRTIYLSHQMDLNSIILDDAAKKFMDSNEEKEFDGTIIGKITRASRIFHLLSLAARTLANAIVSNKLDDPLLFTNLDNMKAITIAIASAPRIWSLFFLANLPNVVILTAVLHSERLLEQLGIAWYYSKPPVDDLVFGSEINKRRESNQYFVACLSSINYASVMIAYESQRLELSPCASETLLYQARMSIESIGMNRDTVTDCEIGKKSMQFVILLAEASSALAMSEHIPAISAMHTFLLKTLAYRLKDASMARTLKVKDAIDMLPLDDRLIGRKLFENFLDAWECLRIFFQTFDICRRENQAAREILHLTADNTVVSFLVEVERTEIHESQLALMLQTRLLKQISDILSSPVLVSLRSDDKFNSYQYLSEELQSDSLTNLSLNDSMDLLLTGPCKIGVNSTEDSSFDHLVRCYSSWESPSLEGLKEQWYHQILSIDNIGVKVGHDVEKIQKTARKEIARENQQADHDSGRVLCPGCFNVYERINGCDALTCGSYLPHTTGQNRQGTCGMDINVVTHRVPPLGADGPLACYIANAQSHHISASILGLKIPPIPQMELPIGFSNTDWIAIASNLFFSVVRGRLLLEVIDKNFFTPLAYIKDLIRSADPMNTGMLLEASLLAGPDGLPRRLLSDDDGGIDTKSSIRGTGDVFTRLLLVADKLSYKLRQFVKIDTIGMGIDDSKENPLFESLCDLTGKSYDTIHNFARRQEEEGLENICGQAVALCIGVLNLIEDGITEGIVIMPEGNSSKSSDYFVRTYIEKIPYPPGSNHWSPLLLNLLNEISLLKLPSAVKCMANAGIDGVICCDQSLSSELSEEKNEKLKRLQEDLILEVQMGIYDVSITAQLQNISSILNDNVDYFLNDSENKYLMDVPTISNYLGSHANPIVKGIFTQLKVKHYGACLLYLRQTIGLLSYYNLRSKTYLNNIDDKSDRHCVEQPYSVNPMEIKATVYHERVPEDWEYLQNRSMDNPEDIKSAGELLSDGHVMVEDENLYEDEDEDENTMDQIYREFPGNSDFNLNYNKSDDEMDVSSPQVLIGGEVVGRGGCYRGEEDIPFESGLLPLKRYLPSSRPLPPLKKSGLLSPVHGESAECNGKPWQILAWEILNNPAYSKDAAATEALKGLKAGLDDSDGLLYLEDDDIFHLSEVLKKVPEKKFLKLLSKVQN